MSGLAATPKSVLNYHVSFLDCESSRADSIMVPDQRDEPTRSDDAGMQSTSADDPSNKSKLTYIPIKYKHRSLNFSGLTAALCRILRCDINTLWSCFLVILMLLLFWVALIIYIFVKIISKLIESRWITRSVRHLYRRMNNTKSADVYQKLALDLDRATGRESWKYERECPSYDYEFVEKSTELLKQLRKRRDLTQTISFLKKSIDTQLFINRVGVLQEHLYSRTYVGTKSILTKFVDQLCKSLDFVRLNLDSYNRSKRPRLENGSFPREIRRATESNQQDKQALVTPVRRCSERATHFIDTPTQAVHNGLTIIPDKRSNGQKSGKRVLCVDAEQVLESVGVMLEHLKRQWGFTALFLSGGGQLGWHHFGVCKVLWDEGLLPQIICGTSAGSIFASYICTKTDKELSDPKIWNYESVRVSCHTCQPDDYRTWIHNFLTQGFTLDIYMWQRATRLLVGDLTFLEAFKKTGRVLNISVTRETSSSTHVLLNYKTAPNVFIMTAVMSSCSVPFLGPVIHLSEKLPDNTCRLSTTYEDEYFYDGTILGDVPIATLRDLWGIQFAVVSQVNPHVFPFCGIRARGEAGSPVSWPSGWKGGFILSSLDVILKECMSLVLRLISLLDLSPRIKGVSLSHLYLDQTYCGNVTLHPPRIHWNHTKLLADPPPKLHEWFINHGIYMTLVKLSFIKNRLVIDRAIDSLSCSAHQMLEVLEREQTFNYQTDNSEEYMVSRAANAVNGSGNTPCLMNYIDKHQMSKDLNLLTPGFDKRWSTTYSGYTDLRHETTSVSDLEVEKHSGFDHVKNRNHKQDVVEEQDVSKSISPQSNGQRRHNYHGISISDGFEFEAKNNNCHQRLNKKQLLKQSSGIHRRTLWNTSLTRNISISDYSQLGSDEDFLSVRSESSIISSDSEIEKEVDHKETTQCEELPIDIIDLFNEQFNSSDISGDEDYTPTSNVE